MEVCPYNVFEVRRMADAASRPSKRSWAFKRPTMGRLGTRHNVQTTQRDGLRCKRRERPAYLSVALARAARLDRDVHRLQAALVAAGGYAERDLLGNAALGFQPGGNRRPIW